MKHWGKMDKVPVEIEPITMFQIDEDAEPIVLIPGRTAYLMGRGKKTWWQMTKDIPLKDGQWFIAVDENGFIMCCERDPNMIMLFGIDLWQIESDKPRDQIFCQKWTGKEVVPWDAS